MYQMLLLLLLLHYCQQSHCIHIVLSMVSLVLSLAVDCVSEDEHRCFKLKLICVQKVGNK